jgi:hypothetical protein
MDCFGGMYLVFAESKSRILDHAYMTISPLILLVNYGRIGRKFIEVIIASAARAAPQIDMRARLA